MNVNDWPLYHYRATVQRIIDGDTIEVLLDLGDRTYRTRRIRLLGYDAPELFSGDDREAGQEARAALGRLLPFQSRVYLTTHLDRESFDRLLAHVFVGAPDGTLYAVDEAMIAGGFGVAS